MHSPACLPERLYFLLRQLLGPLTLQLPLSLVPIWSLIATPIHTRQTNHRQQPAQLTPSRKKRKMSSQKGAEMSLEEVEKRNPMPEEPLKRDADAGYETYVEDWKREEGLPEEAIRQLVASQHQESMPAAADAEINVEIVGSGGRKVPLTELSDFMLDRSRK